MKRNASFRQALANRFRHFGIKRGQYLLQHLHDRHGDAPGDEIFCHFVVPARMLSLEELMPTRAELETITATREGTPEASLLQGERSDILLQTVHKLPPNYRLVLVLHDMEEVPTSEIAKILSLEEGTVRVRLHGARLFLRKELAKAAAGQAHRRACSPMRPQIIVRSCSRRSPTILMAPAIGQRAAG